MLTSWLTLCLQSLERSLKVCMHLGADLIFNPVHAYQKNCIEFCEKFVSDINFLIKIFMFVPK